MTPKDVLLAKQEMVGRYFPSVRGFMASLMAPPRQLGYSPPENVVGIGVGEKLSNQRLTGALAVRVYVRRKAAEAEILRPHRLPKCVNGIPIDVIQSGEIQARVPRPRQDGGISSHRKERIRPAPGGISCGHADITAGTLGAVVADQARKLYILSNNHVLANSNEGSEGDAILQPGPYDGGKAKDRIGTLCWFPKLDFSGAPNAVDAALAEVKASDVLQEICLIGKVMGTAQAARGMVVVKHGRTTGKTQGTVEDIDADIWVDYLPHGTAYFRDSVAIRGTGATPEFSAGGDSGSVIVEEASKKACALLFAGSEVLTFGNPIAAVLDALSVHFP